MFCRGGVSCQPFSSLGDRRENMDQRSRSFPALLRMGFFLNVVAIIMEMYQGSHAIGLGPIYSKEV